eukprot:TRINITY_DN5586_c0_g1_i1.p1 TRINITY_DN5586_c0_g1~~TRINITY_DN5586_c0_g1_i1.p1  ORF type:complete len:134 (-),score=27.66 TRINITY_DN5586_c0_g1_i1:13-372(-)
MTKVFHPNVSDKGEICVNTLKKDWKENLGIKHVLLTIKCLLIYPNPDSALNPDASRMMQESFDEYCKHSAMMTAIHARPKEKSEPANGTKNDADPKKRASSAKQPQIKNVQQKRKLKRL